MNISIILPCHNEQDSVLPLYEELKNAIGKSKLIDKYEIIFVDDGSVDNTNKQIQTTLGKNVFLISLEQNFGKSIALQKGIERAKNEIIVIMDSDLQDPPSEIDKLLQLIQKGNDCAYGWKKNRNDPLTKTISSTISNAIGRMVFKSNLKILNPNFIACRKECFEGIGFFEGVHRFFMIIMEARGYKIEGCEVVHRPRLFGKSKYGVRNRIFKITKDLSRVKKIIRGTKNGN